MGKHILWKNPSYNASNRTVDFNGVPAFSPRGLLAIINQTRGVMLYSTASVDLLGVWGGTNNKVLSLNGSISNAYANTDMLQCFYDFPDTNVATETWTTSVNYSGALDGWTSSNPMCGPYQVFSGKGIVLSGEFSAGATGSYEANGYGYLALLKSSSTTRTLENTVVRFISSTAPNTTFGGHGYYFDNGCWAWLQTYSTFNNNTFKYGAIVNYIKL